MDTHNRSEFCFPHLNTSCRTPVLLWSNVVAIRFVLFSISGVTVVLNMLIIISVSHFRQLHTPTNFLLLSLAVSDFFVGLLLMPAVTIQRTACWSYGDFLCSLAIYMSFIITSASVGDMVLISVDRYVAICYPMHYANYVTVKKVQICICVCWLCSIVYSSPYIHSHQLHKSCDGDCVVIIDHIAGTLDLIFTFIGPITLIVVLYMRVFAVAVSQARAMRCQVAILKVQASVTVRLKKSEMKAARTLGVVVVTFLHCFIPYYGVTLAGNSTSSVSNAIYLFYLNSSLNPVIYTMFYPWCRKAIKLIVTFQILQPGSCEANVTE